MIFARLPFPRGVSAFKFTPARPMTREGFRSAQPGIPFPMLNNTQSMISNPKTIIAANIEKSKAATHANN